MSYLTHFDLAQAPFSKEIADQDLWLPTSKQGVVDEMLDGGSLEGCGNGVNGDVPHG
jgi:hypothetical protein